MMKLIRIFMILEILGWICYTNCIYFFNMWKLVYDAVHWYRCIMIKKIDILGVRLDNYTVREAIMQVETYLTNDVLNTIESISMQMLMDSENDLVLKEVIDSLDLAVLGEKEIMQAAGIESMQRIKETEENDFFFEFFKRIERNKKSIFLLGETEESIHQMKEQLQQQFPKMVVAGEYAVEKCVGNLETVINEMNATTPDVIVSILPSPMQEHFFWEHKEKMCANIWYGIGNLGMKRKQYGFLERIRSVIRRGRLKNSMNKYKKKQYEGVFESDAENEAR